MSDPSEFTDEPVETGFVTATVIPAAPAELTPEGIQAAKALVNLPELTTVQLAQLGRDIAQDIALLPVILARHKITQPQYEFLIQHNAYFKNIVLTETKNWQSVTSTDARLRLQAQVALEQVLPTVASRMGNAAEELRDVVEGAKFLSRVAGVDAPPSGSVTPGERYQIVIDLGADTNVVIAAKSGAAAGALAPGQSKPPAQSQGPGDRAPLLRERQGPRDVQTLPAIPER